MTLNISWQTESVRLSLLGTPESAGKLSWLALTGQQPESVTSRPAQGSHTEEGVWEGGRLVLSAQPGRFDIILTASPSVPDQVPSLGDFSDVSKKFENLLGSQQLPKCLRIALGAKLNVFPGDAKRSREMLTELLPDVTIRGEVSDVSLQFNKIKKFPKIGGLIVNRLAKLSQVVVQTVLFQSGSSLSDKSVDMLQLELDYNTSHTSTLPHTGQYKSVVSVLFNEVRAAVGEKGVE